MNWLKQSALYLAWVLALAGTTLSLYIGEILRIEPCSLCWYQRICLFPLALVLGIATYRQDRTIALYALPLALFGTLFALYQTLEPYLPFLQGVALCGKEGSCLKTPFLLGGFLSFPLVSALGFLLISALLFFSFRK